MKLTNRGNAVSGTVSPTFKNRILIRFDIKNKKTALSGCLFVKVIIQGDETRNTRDRSELKRRTTFKGLNPLAERSVLVALQRRYKVLKNS